MARSLYSIEMDFSKAKRQARELDTIADNLRTLSRSQMEDTLERLAISWTGDNSTKYINKGRQLQANINTTSNAIREVANAIREIAQTIYDAEMEAWELAHNRDS